MCNNRLTKRPGYEYDFSIKENRGGAWLGWNPEWPPEYRAPAIRGETAAFNGKQPPELMMGKPNRSVSAPRTPKEQTTQLSRNIPEIFRTLRSGDHEADQTPQASGLGQDSDSQMENETTRARRPSSVVNLPDLQHVAMDITNNI